ILLDCLVTYSRLGYTHACECQEDDTDGTAQEGQDLAAVDEDAGAQQAQHTQGTTPDPMVNAMLLITC
ncbi:hypothetical protein, partial [Serratia marcescens]|uniref:hypothetical protein n=1 Tax=Serratia marcescens TaxID=615 RepID=UPI00195327E1